MLLLTFIAARLASLSMVLTIQSPQAMKKALLTLAVS